MKLMAEYDVHILQLANIMMFEFPWWYNNKISAIELTKGDTYYQMKVYVVDFTSNVYRASYLKSIFSVANEFRNIVARLCEIEVPEDCEV